MPSKTRPADSHGHLSRDPVLAPLLDRNLLKRPRKVADLPLYLYRTIINQQLSTRAGDVIYSRFLGLFDGGAITAEAVLSMSTQQLRSVGLSAAKAAYIRNVAQFHIDEGLTQGRFSHMTDEAAIGYLTRIKGIGRWTAEIFLTAALGREDVFPVDDLILQKNMAKLYKIETPNRKELLKTMMDLAENWRPYRSYASRCIWRWTGE